VNFYTVNPPVLGDVTMVALDLDRVDDLAHVTRQLAEALRINMSKVGNVLWKVQYSTKQHETRNGERHQSKFDYHLWDLGSLAAGLVSSDVAPPEVMQAAASVAKALVPGAGCVLSERHRGSWFDGIAGTSVYLMPPGKQRISPFYSKLEFANDTRWGAMLSTYHDQVT
jgi:hypothetical protein